LEAKRYHQPRDQLGSDWNFDGMVDDARFGFLTALEIANTDCSPTLHSAQYLASGPVCFVRRGLRDGGAAESAYASGPDQ